MKNLFDASWADQVKTRLGKLESQSERRWGKMTAAQMLAHCSVSMQWAVGEVVPEMLCHWRLIAVNVFCMGRQEKSMALWSLISTLQGGCFARNAIQAPAASR